MNQHKNETNGLRIDEAQTLKLGRTLRRISRTTRDMMKQLGIDEDSVRIPRKKKKPKSSPSQKEA